MLDSKKLGGEGGREGGRGGEAGRRLCYRSPEQRFPPTVIRLDDEQLQFHHICGRGPRHTSKAVHAWEPLSRLPGRAGRRTGEEVVLPRLLLLLLRGGGLLRAARTRIAINRARPNYSSWRYRSIASDTAERNADPISCSLSLSLSLFSFFSFSSSASVKRERGRGERERERGREGGREGGRVNASTRSARD